MLLKRCHRILGTADIAGPAGLFVKRKLGRIGFGPGFVALLDRDAQGVLNGVNPGFQLTPTVFRGQQPFLHLGHLRQRHVKAGLRVLCGCVLNGH